ncbi:Uncharacterised protein [Mycobacteroides abscessus subsp. abscessus]|nr:Uncharacterised protein [Mycobacteroides abscessus subsp. abscessus]
MVELQELLGRKQIHRREPSGGCGGHRDEHAFEPLDEPVDVGRVEHVGVVLEAQAEFLARHGLHRQRVVVLLVAAELGDGQVPDATRRGGAQRVVLIREQRVEQLFLAGDPVHLGE